MRKKLGCMLICVFTIMILLIGCRCEGEKQTTIPNPDILTYESYMAMNGEEQQTFMESFESIEAFVAWFDAAKDSYMDGLEEIGKGGTE